MKMEVLMNALNDINKMNSKIGPQTPTFPYTPLMKDYYLDDKAEE